ncbi:MAG: DNA primase [Clostridia bacterium]|nr:DNA primase [Clostridia bacterium]
MENTEFSKFIEELKEKSDIVQVISKYVPLERKGKTYWARCPFHGEKTPSFAINEVDQYYHCFGCKAGGNVINFVMNMESVDFMGAVRILAEMANMQVPEFKGGIKQSQDDASTRKEHRDRLLALMKATAKYYNENLFAGKNPEALNYLVNKRQVSREVAAKFGLGASLGYGEVVEFLHSKGFTDKEILDAGVAKQNNYGKLYDSVAGRLVFPLIDIMGNVIGFCGRLLEKADFAKYINTAETELFSKGKTLYGINLVKKKKQTNPQDEIKYLIIVEGQMDVVSLHKAGFDTAVASMGTALTEHQAKLIKRFTDNVLICYDGDFAGKKATIRGLEILKDNGLNVKVVSLPEGMDPDDVINKLGRDAYVKMLKEALPLIDFKLELVKRESDLSSKEGRSKYIEKALEVLKGLDSDVEREVYIDVVSEVSNTNKDFLKRQLRGLDVDTDIVEDKKKQISYSRQAVQTVDNAIIKAQKFVLSCMLHLKPFAYFPKDISYIFDGDEYVQVANAIESARGSVSSKQVIEKCEEYLGEQFSEVFSEVVAYESAFGEEENEAKYFNDSLWMIYKNYLENRLDELNKQVSSEPDLTERKKLITEIAEIVNKIKNKKVDLQ